MGQPRQPGGPHAEGRFVRAGSDSTAGKVKTLLPSPRASKANLGAGPERHLPRLPNGQGYGGHFHLGLLAASIQKGARQAWHGRQATNPLWGFPFATTPACAGLGEGGGAPPPRRAGQGRSPGPCGNRDIYLVGTPSTRQGRHPQPPLVGRREGRSRRRREPDRSRDPYIAENAYFTTPPPSSTRLRLHRRPQREHHRRRLLPFLPP
jgi:hypothetical protein